MSRSISSTDVLKQYGTGGSLALLLGHAGLDYYAGTSAEEREVKR